MSSGYFPAGSSVLRAVHSERAVGLNYGQRALMLRRRAPGELRRDPGQHALGRAAVPAPGAHGEGLRDDLLRQPRGGRPGARLRREASPARRGRARRRHRALARRHHLHGLRPRADAVDGGGHRRLRRGLLRDLRRAAEPGRQGRAVARLPALRRALRDVARLGAGELRRLSRLLGRRSGPAARSSSRTRRAPWGSRSPSRSRCRDTCTRPARSTTSSSSGTLPKRVRRMYGIRWTPAHQAAFRSVVAGLRAVRPLTPERMRRGENTASFEMVARTERDLVAAGRATLPSPAATARA